MTADIEERISARMVDRLAIVVSTQDENYKLHVLVRLIGDRFGYEAVFKVDKMFLTPEEGDLDQVFDEAKKAIKEVLQGKRTLNAIIA